LKFGEDEMGQFEKDMKLFAKVVTCSALRLSGIEKFHGGPFPKSITGDRSDIEVVGPKGSVPWNEVSRISQEEMKDLMIKVTNRLYSIMLDLERKEGSKAIEEFWRIGRVQTAKWDEPEYDEGVVGTIDPKTGKKYD